MAVSIIIYIFVEQSLKQTVMKIELKGVKFYEKMSEETNAFFADVYVDGKKCGFAKNDGRGGNTFVSPYGGVNRDLFVECENWLKTQPQINIGSEEKPYMIDSDMESMVDHLFENWLKERDQKKLEKKMETCLIWGTPNRYSFINFKSPINNVDKMILQRYIDKYRPTLKEGEKFLNTNLVGVKL